MIGPVLPTNTPVELTLRPPVVIVVEVLLALNVPPLMASPVPNVCVPLPELYVPLLIVAVPVTEILLEAALNDPDVVCEYAPSVKPPAAVVDAEPASVSVPLTVLRPVMVFVAEPASVKFEYVTGMTVCAAPL